MKTKLEPKHWFFMGVLIAIGVFAIFLYLIPELMPEEPKVQEVEYNYFKFKKAGPVWDTLVMYDDKLLQPSFRFLPTEIEEVPIEGRLDEAFGNETIYLTFDPLADPNEFQTLTIAVSEMGMNIVKGLERQIEAGCTQNETEACFNRTIVDCSNTEKSVIFFNPIEEPKVILRGKCIELRGKGFELVKSVDRVLYAWYGILKKNIITPRVQPQN